MSSSHRKGKEHQSGDHIQCQQCKKIFIYKKRKTGKKFCSHACYFKHRERKKVCPICNKEFKLRNHENTCSAKCMGVLRKRGRTAVYCKNCGQTVTLPPSLAEHRSFCTTKCRKEWLSKNLAGSDNPNWKGGDVKRFCSKCGKEFQVSPGRKKAQYCSRKCSGMDSARIKMGPRKENQAKKELEAEGYYVTKSGGSLGVFDLIALNVDGVRAIQVKTTKLATKLTNYNKDIKKMKAVGLPPGSTREVWIWEFIKGWIKHEV